MELTALERRALEAALAGQSPWYEALRNQFKNAVAISRKYTGCGFYTQLSCEGCEPAINPPIPKWYPGATADYPGDKDGIWFTVYIKGGFIVQLEGASSGTTWPEDEDQIDPIIFNDPIKHKQEEFERKSKR